MITHASRDFEPSKVCISDYLWTALHWRSRKTKSSPGFGFRITRCGFWSAWHGVNGSVGERTSSKGGRALSGHPGLSDRGTDAGLVYIVSATGDSQSRAKSPRWLSAREPRITYKHYEHQPLLVSGLQMPRMTTCETKRFTMPLFGRRIAGNYRSCDSHH